MRILIYGLGKSGTTALHVRLKDAMQKELGSSVAEIFEPVKRSGDVFEKLDGTTFNLAENLLVKALMPKVKGRGVDPESALKDFSDFDKKIFINRDPRDRWISGFFYRWYHRHNPVQVEFEKAFRLTQFKEKHPSDLPFFALNSISISGNEALRKHHTAQLSDVSSFIEKAEKDNWFILKYEDFMDGNLADLEDYLGMTISLKDKEDKRFTHVARSKGYGSWRRWFTPEDVEFYREVCNPFLEKHGYDSQDWNLESVGELSSAEGSEYMYKLFHGHHHKSRKTRKWGLFR